MHQWDLSPFTVTPAARLLSRCVSVGAVSQEELDSASSAPSPAVSSHLQEAEQHIRMQRQLDELQLQLELLRVDELSADVTHSFHLARKLQVLQKFGGHLKDVLKDHKNLRQRLMKPLDCSSLPVQAHLHRCIVESTALMMDFIETLEEKLSSAHSRDSATDRLNLLSTSHAQLLAQAAEMETVCSQVLQWKTAGGGSRVTSDP